MINILKDSDVKPICQDKFRWTAVDKERSDDGLLTDPKLVTWQTCICTLYKNLF